MHTTTAQKTCSIALACWVSVSGLCWGGDPDRAQSDEQIRPLADMSLSQLRLFLKGVPEDWRSTTDEQQGVPPPEIVRPVPQDAVRHDLVDPEEFPSLGLSLIDAIAQRRSHRDFTADSLTLEEVSILLWHTQGGTGHAANTNERPLRATPSGGARYPLETYLFANRVEDLETGLYRLDPLGFQLVEVKQDPDLPRQLQAACFGAQFISDAAVVVAFAAVPYRTEWRYGYIAHRLIAYEAGHAAQNLYLTAGAIGGGACAVAAYHQPTLDRLLQVDGENEFSLYLVAIGKIDSVSGNGTDP